MAISLIIYIFTFIISSFACEEYELLADSRKIKGKYSISETDVYKLICIILIFVPPILITTFRGIEVGTDNSSYLEIYDYNKTYNLKEYLNVYGTWHHTYEIGFQQIQWIAYKVHGGYNLVKAICGFIIVFFMWRGALYYHRKFKIDSGFCVLLFYLMEFSYSLNAVRFSIALSIFFYAFQFVIEKRPFMYFFYCFIMVLFHNAMIIVAVFYLINYIRYNHNKTRFKYTICFIIVIITVFLRGVINVLLPRLTSSFSRLDEYEIDTTAEFGLGIYVFLVLFLVPLIRWDSLVKKDVEWTCILIVALLYIPFRFLSYFNVWLNRLMRISEVMLCIEYCGLLKIPIYRDNKILWRMYITLLVFGYYIYSSVLLKSSEVYPYVFDFSNHF